MDLRLPSRSAGVSQGSQPAVPPDGADGRERVAQQFFHITSRLWPIARRYILPRIFTIFAISVVTFAATNAIGVDVARRTLGKEASPQQLADFRHRYGLDRPILDQYFVWLRHFVTGDWGTSPVSGLPVIHGVVSRMELTLILALLALAVSIPVSIALGVFMAKRLGSSMDLTLSVGTLVLAGSPIFVIGILMEYVFSVRLGWTPIDSSALAFGSWGAQTQAFVLPSIVLALSLVPHFSRTTRAAFRGTLSSQYAQAAALRGLRSVTITWRYLMPNAAAPIVNVVALEAMWLVGGVVLVENVFGFPGLGSLLVSAIQTGDLITVQAVVLVTGIMFVLISLFADLAVLALNPRLRRQA
jgi:peptide/nickel transport system permease protein